MFWACSGLGSSSVPGRRVKFLRPREKPKNFVTGLGDLPECLIRYILCLTKPADVARLACVNRSFKATAYSDDVWIKMLPPSYTEILAHASDAPASTCSKKEVYDFLSEGVLLQNGTRDIWLDRATGAVCQSIGVKGLGFHDLLLSRRQLSGSRFANVVCIRTNSFVWLGPTLATTLSLEGIPRCSLSPGTYVLSWRLFLRDESGPARCPDCIFSPSVGPVKFSFEATGNERVNAECYLSPKPAPQLVWLTRTQLHRKHVLGFRDDPDGWIELDVGKFNVGSEDSQIEIEFSVANPQRFSSCGLCPGLYVDCVMIRPSFAIPCSKAWRFPFVTLAAQSYPRHRRLTNCPSYNPYLEDEGSMFAESEFCTMKGHVFS